jgi:hypothetical protein
VLYLKFVFSGRFLLSAKQGCNEISFVLAKVHLKFGPHNAVISFMVGDKIECLILKQNNTG